MRTVVSLFLFFLCTSVFSQEVPLNPDVMYGKLSNELTYYIQKNTLPKDRAMFYLVVNTGGINETEEQNGLAHFCEHMAFNGTKNFPGKGIINYLESNGVSFGGGVNAGTSSAYTMYTLTNLPVIRKSFIDSALLILREWATNISFTTDEINKERGVIHEEWRTRGGASRRMGKITNAVLYEGSKYANHDVIGTLDVIDNFDPELVRKFYKDWYRPDNQAIIVVGDIDKDEIKKTIEQLFGDIQKPKKKMADSKTLIKPNKDLKYVSATDKEAQGVAISLYIKHPGPEKKDLNYYKQTILTSLYSAMLSDRINEMLQVENPPMLSASASYGGLTKFQDSYIASISALNNDPARSFKAAMVEIERINRHGFTETELERTKSRLVASVERTYNERDKQQSQNLVSQYAGNFLQGNPAPGAEYNFKLIKEYLPTVTLAQVNGLSNKWLTEENRVIVATAPEKEGYVVPSETELRNAFSEIQAMKIDPYTDKVVPTSLITEELKGSPVIKEENVKEFDGTLLTLANGVKVWIKPTDNMKDEIRMLAFSDGGYSVLPVEDLSSAIYVSSAKSTCGLDNFSQVDLRRMLAGKNASVSAGLSELEEQINGSSTIKDFETMLQLTYLQFKPSRRDDVALNSLKQRNLESVRNRMADPNTAMSDTLRLVTTNYNKRTYLTTPEFYDSMIADKVYSIANERFCDAGDFNFLFVGNIDIATAKPLIEKYIGSIPDLPRQETWTDHKLVPAKALVQKKFTAPMKDPKAMVQLYFYGEIPCTPENVEYLNAVIYILRMRYTEIIREKEGGTYSVSVSGSVTSRPVNNYKFYLSFTCAPERADFLKGLLVQGLTDIKENGVTADEVEKTKLNMLKEDAERMKTNSYILDRIKNYVNNGIYTPLPENSTTIYNSLDGKKIQEMANKVFGKEYVDVVMVPATVTLTPAAPVD